MRQEVDSDDEAMMMMRNERLVIFREDVGLGGRERVSTDEERVA